MMYSMAICDDISEQIMILKDKTDNIFEELNEEVRTDLYQSGKEIYEKIKTREVRYDIILLDVEMPQINGIKLGKMIRDLDKYVIIIYATGYVDYALNAYESRPFDYIIKPINDKQLKRALEDALSLCKNFSNKKNSILVIDYNKEIVKVKLHQLLYIEKIKNKVKYVCDNSIYENYDSLKNIIVKLEDEQFIQPHQGFIVNINKVVHYEKQMLYLEKDYTVPVSKKNINKVKKCFYKNLGI